MPDTGTSTDTATETSEITDKQTNTASNTHQSPPDTHLLSMLTTRSSRDAVNLSYPLHFPHLIPLDEKWFVDRYLLPSHYRTTPAHKRCALLRLVSDACRAEPRHPNMISSARNCAHKSCDTTRRTERRTSTRSPLPLLPANQKTHSNTIESNRADRTKQCSDPSIGEGNPCFWTMFSLRRRTTAPMKRRICRIRCQILNTCSRQTMHASTACKDRSYMCSESARRGGTMIISFDRL